MIELTPVTEAKRTYTFEDGDTLSIADVVEFGMPGSTHRLKDKDGNLYIVKPNWRSIKIEGAKGFAL